MQHVSLSSFSIQRKSRGTILQFVFLTAGLTFILLICSLTFFPVAHAAGNFSYSLSGSARPGESIELSLIMPDDAPPVSGFRCGVSLEGSALTCSRIKGNGAVAGNSLYTSQATSDPVCVYAAAGGAASKLSGKLVTFTLLIPENAKGGDVYTVGLWADQICGENGKAVEGFSSYSQSLVIPVADTNGDRLASLKPDTGELSPAFSPDIFSYSLRVPSSVKEVHFEAKAQNERFVRAGEDSIRQAGRNLLISFRESVAKELNVIVGDKVKEALSSEALSQLIFTAVENWTKDTEAEDLSVLVGREELASLEAGLLAGLKDRMREGVTLKVSDDFEGGFRISVQDGQAYYDYSAEAVTELLSVYLTPKLISLMKEAENV